VVIISARDDEPTRAEAQKIGATAYYGKPFSPMALLKEIEKLGAHPRSNDPRWSRAIEEALGAVFGRVEQALRLLARDAQLRAEIAEEHFFFRALSPVDERDQHGVLEKQAPIVRREIAERMSASARGSSRTRADPCFFGGGLKGLQERFDELGLFARTRPSAQATLTSDFRIALSCSCMSGCSPVRGGDAHFALTRPVTVLAGGSGVSRDASTRKRRRNDWPSATPATKSSSPTPQGNASSFDSGRSRDHPNLGSARARHHVHGSGRPCPPTTLPGSADGHASSYHPWRGSCPAGSGARSGAESR